MRSRILRIGLVGFAVSAAVLGLREARLLQSIELED